MLKVISITAFLLIFSVGGHLKAQTVDSSSKGLVAIYKSDLGIKNLEFYTSSRLEIGSDGSKFSWISYPGSSIRSDLKYSGGVVTQDVVEGDPEGRPIYTDFTDSLIFWKIGDRNDDSSFLIDTLGINTPEWKILNEYSPCGDSLICGKATSTWYGRTYEALYVPGIETKVGPYKFHGLPGMIYSIHSADSIVSFSLMEFRITPHFEITDGWNMPNSSKAMTHSEHRDVIFRKFTRFYNQGYEQAIQDEEPDAYIEKFRFTYAKQFFENK